MTWTDGGVQARFLDPDGLGPSFPIHDASTWSSAVAPDGVGGYVLVSIGSTGVFAGRLDASGAPITLPALVSEATGASSPPDVAVAPDGSFLVVWSDILPVGSDQSEDLILARAYSPDGTPYSDPFQVNLSTEGPTGESTGRGGRRRLSPSSGRTTGTSGSRTRS